MGGLFSKKAKEKPKRKQLGRANQDDGEMSDKDKAKFDLRVAKKKIKKFSKKLEGEVETYREKARLLMKAKKKDRALICLRMSKFKQKKMVDLDNQIFKLESMIEEINSQAQSLEVFNAMKVATGALQSLQKQMPIEAVETLMDDNAEASAYVEEMSELLGEDVAEDDEEVLAEMQALEALQADEIAVQLPEAPQQSLEEQLPQAPTAAPAVTEEKEAVKEKRVMVAA